MTIDIQRVRAEIAEDVRQRRAEGEYPAGFERELDLLFARFAPADVAESIDEALERAEDAAGIDPEIPIASNNAVFGIVKRVMAKFLGWYHVFLAQQITSFTVTLHNVVRRLVDKVQHLETVTGAMERTRTEGARVVAERDDAAWAPLVVETLANQNGRVLVAECGDGALLAAMVAAGIDAYGVEPNAELADTAVAREIDVRVDEPDAHLRSVAAGDLSAVVLRACVERRAPGELLALIDQSLLTLAAGGRLVVCSAHPQSWGRDRTTVEADLSPGHPLHPETWSDVLTRRGFTDVTIRELGAQPLPPLPATSSDATVMNANLARISEALFGAESFVLVATRP
ncbi:MAG: methyltransferase domain-containing protein [Actinomycetota bacterium]